MIAASIYVLNVRGGRRETLLFAVAAYSRAGEAVTPFAHSRRAPLIVLASFANGKITHVGDGRKGGWSGTELVRLNITNLEPLKRPLTFKRLVRHVPQRVRASLSRILSSGGLLPPKTLAAVIDALIKLDPTLATRFRRFSATRAQWIAALPPQARENLALQKETVATALQIAGIDKKELLDWSPTEAMPTSFLDGLPEAYVREDAMLVTDFSTLPGFDALDPVKHVASRTFIDQQNPSIRVTVVMANRSALEEQTGADLIYYNESYRSFVFVQYKAMERGKGGPEFRWADADQFMTEIGRMDATLRALEKVPPDDDPDGFRLHSNPFFLKFCPRVVFNPDDSGLFPGIYVPLALWKALAGGKHLKGPKGGNLLTYGNLRRKLTNSEFVILVGNAWVGTTINQSALLVEVVREVLASQKTLTFAIKRKVPPDPQSETVSDQLSDLLGDTEAIDEEDFLRMISEE